MLISQEDTAAAAENDTQPAVDEQEAAQGTEAVKIAATNELQRGTYAAAARNGELCAQE